jgi:hypothetical protein
MNDRKVKLILFEGGYQWEERWHKERVREGEYGTCILYSCMNTVQGNLLKLF